MNITSVLPLRRVGAIVLLTGVLVACDRSINVDEVIDRAAVLYESGAHRASVIELKNAVREDPANARARQLLGENYIELGDANSAEKELRRALDLGVDAAVLAVPLARVMLLQGRYEDALDAAEAAAAPAGSARAAVLVVRGRAYGSLADLDAAEAAFRAALNEDRSSVDAHVGLARTALQQADFAHATVVLEDAMQLAPDGPSVIELAGDLSYSQGDYAASEVAFVTLVNAAPDDPFYRARLVQALMAQSKNTQAIAHLDTILKDSPSYPLANYMRAIIAYEAGDYRSAKLHGERALAAIPDHRPSQLLAGAASFAEGQHEQARSYLQDYVTAVPEDQQARRLLGEVQLRLGDASQAVITLSPIVAGTEGDAQLLTMIGSAALETQDLQAGRTYFDDAPGVSGSILEGLDEILTVIRLGLPPQLRRSLACTNAIENAIGTVRTVQRNVKRWRNAEMALRWTAAGLLEAQKTFRRLKAYRQLPILDAALREAVRKAGAKSVIEDIEVAA